MCWTKPSPGHAIYRGLYFGRVRLSKGIEVFFRIFGSSGGIRSVGFAHLENSVSVLGCSKAVFSAGRHSAMSRAPRRDFIEAHQTTLLAMRTERRRSCAGFGSFLLGFGRIWLVLFCRFQTSTDLGQFGFPATVGEKAEVADAHEAMRRISNRNGRISSSPAREGSQGHSWFAQYCNRKFVCDIKNIAPNYPALG